MNEQLLLVGSPEMQAECGALEEAAQRSLKQRRASGEILTYNLDGWVVQEHPSGRIERLACGSAWKFGSDSISLLSCGAVAGVHDRSIL